MDFVENRAEITKIFEVVFSFSQSFRYRLVLTVKFKFENCEGLISLPCKFELTWLELTLDPISTELESRKQLSKIKLFSKFYTIFRIILKTVGILKGQP